MKRWSKTLLAFAMAVCLCVMPVHAQSVVSGSTVGGMDRSELFYPDFLSNDRRNAYIALHDVGATTDRVADHFGRFGYTASLSTACSSAANAIIQKPRMTVSAASAPPAHPTEISKKTQKGTRSNTRPSPNRNTTKTPA